MFVRLTELKYVSKYGTTDPNTGLVSLKVQFFDIDVKLDILSKRARLRTSNITIQEHLTLKQSDNQVKLAKHNGLVGSMWTTNGTVWAVNSSEETPTIMDDIESVRLFNERHARPDDAGRIERMDDGVPIKAVILEQQQQIAENRQVRQPRRYMVAGTEPLLGRGHGRGRGRRRRCSRG